MYMYMLLLKFISFLILNIAFSHDTYDKKNIKIFNKVENLQYEFLKNNLLNISWYDDNDKYHNFHLKREENIYSNVDKKSNIYSKHFHDSKDFIVVSIFDNYVVLLHQFNGVITEITTSDYHNHKEYEWDNCLQKPQIPTTSLSENNNSKMYLIISFYC